MRVGLGVLALVLGLSSPAFAEWQLKPFLGVTFGGETTFTTSITPSAAQMLFFRGAACSSAK